MPDCSIALFSYGTLQEPEVQLANYGRLIEGEADALRGYVLAQLAIENPHVIAVSGKAVHTIARPTGDPADRIAGTVLSLTAPELEASDAYEDPEYTRVQVRLESGRTALVYVAKTQD
jgi:hypothetical protein